MRLIAMRLIIMRRDAFEMRLCYGLFFLESEHDGNAPALRIF